MSRREAEGKPGSISSRDLALMNLAAYREPSPAPRQPENEPGKEPKRAPGKNDPYGCDDPHALDIQACSATECTGLIPALPESEAELESYAQMYGYSGDIFQG